MQTLPTTVQPEASVVSESIGDITREPTMQKLSTKWYCMHLRKQIQTEIKERQRK